MGDFLGTVDSLADLSDAVRKAVEKLEELQKTVDALKAEVDGITATATTLASDMAKFYQKLSEQGLALPADATPEEIGAALEQFQQTYQAEYTALLRTGKTLYGQLQGVPDKLDAVKKAGDEFVTAVEEAKKAADKVVSTNDKDPDGSISQEATKTLQNVLDEMVSLVDGALADLTVGAIQAGKDAVQEIIDAVLEDTGLKDVVSRYQQIANGTYFSTPMSQLAKEDLTAFLQSVYTMCQTHSPDAMAAYFKSILTPDLQFDPEQLAEKISEILSQAMGDLINESTNRVAQLLEDLVKLVKGLFDLNTFYDPDLDSFVNTAGASSSPYQSFLEALGNLLSAAESLGTSLAEGGIAGLLGALKAMTDMFRAIVKTMDALISIVKTSLESIASIISDFWNGNTRALYERLLISGYMRHNLPCRLDADTILEGKKGNSVSLTGFSYADLPKLPSGGVLDEVMGGFTGLGQFISNLEHGHGDDPIFKGAHLEYIRAGTNSELANQAISFFDLYFLRLLLDIPTVFTDGEVRSLAASATIASWVVYVIYILVEPYCDTLLLVNGQDVPFVKGKCWLVTSKLGEFMKKLGDATLGEPLKAELDKFLKEEGFGSDTSGGDDWKDTGYQTHMLVLLLIFVKPEDQIKRLQDLIEMEATEYYRQKGESFQMTKTYTAVSLSADADLNPLLDLGEVTGSGPFRPTTHIKQTISY